MKSLCALASCLVTLLMLVPRAASADADRLVDTFERVCAAAFPTFEDIDTRVVAVGGWLEPAAEPSYSRVPFIVPEVSRQGATGERHAAAPEDLAIDYAEDTALDLPAAGCSIANRRPIDEATVARLLGGFEASLFVGENEGSFLSGPYRSWIVRANGRKAILTITEPRFGGRIVGVDVALVRLDETLIDELTPSRAMP